MTSKIKQVFSSPVTHFNVLVVGFLVMIQSLHMHTHFTMDMDPESFVRKFCKKNLTKCEYIISNFR